MAKRDKQFGRAPAGGEAPREVYAAACQAIADALASDGFEYVRSKATLKRKTSDFGFYISFQSSHNNVAGELVRLWIHAGVTSQALKAWRATPKPLQMTRCSAPCPSERSTKAPPTACGRRKKLWRRPTEPLSARSGEREGPVAQQREGEVGGDASVIVRPCQLHDTSPSHCQEAMGPSLSPLRAERDLKLARSLRGNYWAR